MGVYYEYAIVHGRVLIWWHDLNNVPHSKWIEEPQATVFVDMLNEFDSLIQRDLASLVKIKD